MISNSHLNRNVRKRTNGHVHQAKIQIRLRIRVVWTESSLCFVCIRNFASWNRSATADRFQDAKFLHADKGESDQTARILVFVRCTWEKVRFLTLRFKKFVVWFFVQEQGWHKMVVQLHWIMGKSPLNIFDVTFSRPEGDYFPGQVVHGLLTLEAAGALKLTGTNVFINIGTA